MAKDVYMYDRTSSAGVEAMNNANKSVREKTAVDPCNAILLIVELECDRFCKQRKAAWEEAGPLTPSGYLIFDEYSKINSNDYSVATTEMATCNQYHVRKLIGGRALYVVEIPHDDTQGSRFGSCTCGGPQVTGKPCHHMVAVVKRMNNADLSLMKIMPYWWTTMYWKTQLPMTEEVKGGITMETVKFGQAGDELVTGDLTLKYCPDWTAPRKKGRPKGNERKQSAVEKAMTGKRKRNANKKTRSVYCDFCDNFGHTARKCTMRRSQGDEDSMGSVAI
jgi:hypothetical protein